ncbi:MAG: hypothetical protein U0892_15555 [Pirellulales bacterium]
MSDEGKRWRLKELDMQNGQGLVTGRLESKEGGTAKTDDEKMTLDASVRIWRGRECISMDEMISEGAWPAAGKKSLDNQSVLLGVTWRPTPDNIFTRFHISDIWLDDVSMQRASHNQTEVHKAFIRSRWMLLDRHCGVRQVSVEPQ